MSEDTEKNPVLDTLILDIQVNQLIEEQLKIVMKEMDGMSISDACTIYLRNQMKKQERLDFS